MWNCIPVPLTTRGPLRLYADFLHRLARIEGTRTQAFSTYFLRNRPELELIRRLVERKGQGEALRIALLGCSTGAEAYSVAWRIRSARPDLKLVLLAMDISKEAVELAKRGAYSLKTSEISNTAIFERLTTAEMREMFEMYRDRAVVKPWIKEGIEWRVGDVGKMEMLEVLGPQDMVIANNFLCHMDDFEAERCLRNIARLVSPNGHLFVSGVDLDVRMKVALDLGWKPIEELLEEIHEGDGCLRPFWPCHYAGLEPLSKKGRDWKIRYACAFEVFPEATLPPAGSKDEHKPATRNREISDASSALT